MEQFGAFLDLLLTLSKALIAVTLPVFVGNIGNFLLHYIPPRDLFAIPVFSSLAKTVGLMTGVLVLHASFDPGHYSLEELFLPSSPWNVSFGQFLFEHANPFMFSLFPAASGPHDTPVWRTVLLASVVVLLAVIILLAFRIWPHRPALRAIGTCAGIAALTAWLVVYLVSLTLWSLHVLNFWAFALLGFYYHYRTSRH